MLNDFVELKLVDHVELIHTCLQNILKDPENSTIDSSLPSSILLILEQVRSTLQEQQEQIQNMDKASIIEEAQKGKCSNLNKYRYTYICHDRF
jgi:hypothetical protein